MNSNFPKLGWTHGTDVTNRWVMFQNKILNGLNGDIVPDRQTDGRTDPILLSPRQIFGGIICIYMYDAYSRPRHCMSMAQTRAIGNVKERHLKWLQTNLYSNIWYIFVQHNQIFWCLVWTNNWQNFKHSMIFSKKWKIVV